MDVEKEGFESLANLGDEFLKTHADKTVYTKIFSWWDELVGPQISAISNPVFYKNHTLLVEISDHHWLTELRYHLPDIIKKYEKKFHQSEIKKTSTITEKTFTVSEIKLKYNPNLSKPILKKLSSPAENNSENHPTRTTLKSSNEHEINNQNVDQKLEHILEAMKTYASGKTPFTPLAGAKLEKTKKLQPSHGEKLAEPAPLHSVEHSARTIDRYYPRNGFYSEFIFPSDELQNFDLY